MFSSKFYVELFMITVMSLQFSRFKSEECDDIYKKECPNILSYGYSCDDNYIRKVCRKTCGCPLGLIKTIYYFE